MHLYVNPSKIIGEKRSDKIFRPETNLALGRGELFEGDDRAQRRVDSVAFLKELKIKKVLIFQKKSV